MTSHYVLVTNKLYLDDRNNDYIVLCKLGSHTIRGCRVTGVGSPPVLGSKKKPGLNRVKIQNFCDSTMSHGAVIHLTRLCPIKRELCATKLSLSIKAGFH